MKKIYQNPDLKIIKVQPMQMIAESMEANRYYGTGEGITLGSRRGGGLWDEDEEDDEEYFGY